TIKRRVHSDRVVVMLDACHSGAASPAAKGLSRTGNINAEELMQGSGQMVISSSMPQQVSWELKDGQNGAFTKFLIEGLRVKGQKTNLSEAFDFMKDKVQETVLRERGVLQTPVLKQLWEGKQLQLCSKPTAPRPGLDDSTENHSESHSVTSLPAATTSVQAPVTSVVPTRVPSASTPVIQATDKASADALIAATLANLKPAGVPPLMSSTPVSSQSDSSSQSTAPKFKVAVFKAYGPTKYTLDDPSRVGQWGGIKNKSEFDNVPSLLSNYVAQELEDSLKSKKGKSVAFFDAEAPGARNMPGEARWQTDAKYADASYVLVLSVDDCKWESGTIAHTYGMTISAHLFSASGANVYKTGYSVVKKPNFADMKGGRVYFETVVVPEIAEKVSKLIVKSIPKN
ncbi:MAG: caspase family protein, partial [Cyanobacteria bacterium]|nr:caspase family protein [Cyanobacteriota bacterium]